MKKLSLIAALIAFATPSFAADYPVKSPVGNAPAKIFDWSGFYIGAHCGGNWDTANIQVAGFSGTKPSGWECGPQLAGIYQFSSGAVLGAIADLDIGDVSATGKVGKTGFTARGDLVGSVRAMLGYAGFANGWLPYITGGVAGQRNNITVSAAGFTSSEVTQFGWVGGAGLMWNLAALGFPNTSLYGEYLYYGFGGATYAVAPGFAIPAKSSAQEFKGGINFKL